MNKVRRIIRMCLCIVAVTSLTACSSGGSDSDTAKESAASPTKQSDSSVAEYEKTKLELKDASRTTLDDGSDAILINATFTNDGSDGIYALSAFAVNAFQNDTQIEDASDINGNQASLTTEVKDGKSVDVQYCFKLSDNSPVEVDVCEPTADQNKLVEKIYTVK